MQTPSLPSPNYADNSTIADAQIVTGVDNDGSVFTHLSSSVGIMPLKNPKPSMTAANKDQLHSGEMKYLQQVIRAKEIFSFFHSNPLIILSQTFHLASVH